MKGAALFRLGLLCEKNEEIDTAKEYFLRALPELQDNGIILRASTHCIRTTSLSSRKYLLPTKRISTCSGAF